jgi:hypothetical protein
MLSRNTSGCWFKSSRTRSFFEPFGPVIFVSDLSLLSEEQVCFSLLAAGDVACSATGAAGRSSLRSCGVATFGDSDSGHFDFRWLTCLCCFPSHPQNEGKETKGSKDKLKTRTVDDVLKDKVE